MDLSESLKINLTQTVLLFKVIIETSVPLTSSYKAQDAVFKDGGETWAYPGEHLQ